MKLAMKNPGCQGFNLVKNRGEMLSGCGHYNINSSFRFDNVSVSSINAPRALMIVSSSESFKFRESLMRFPVRASVFLVMLAIRHLSRSRA
jgi:hypothetical protein